MSFSSSDDDTSALSLQSSLEDLSLEFTTDRKFIRWANANPRHPRNWTTNRKVYDTAIIIWLEFFTTAISASGASAAADAQHEFGISHTLSVFLFISIYLIGQSIGGIVFPPFSECFGRRWLYIISMAIYCISCLTTGLVPSISGVVVGRFFSGFTSAIPTAVVPGSIEDLYNAKDRIVFIFLWAMLANTGLLIIGPIMGTYIVSGLGWRWIFYIGAIVIGITTGFLFNLQESRHTILLENEVSKLRKVTGMQELRALNPDHVPDLRTFLQSAVFRPARFLVTEPIVFIVSTIASIAFAMVYLFTEALPAVYGDMGFTTQTSSLPFLALGCGFLLSSLTRVLDHAILDKLYREGKPITPESKLIGFSIGAPVLALGLWWFAWTIPPLVPNVHWIVSATALVPVGYSLNEIDTVLAGYLADSYLSYASSGFAAMSFLRAILSAIFPCSLKGCTLI
uniref:Major facilitator superfamily (MFS) profile domain-containing protein n=1 Tax=Bionectria ochroleuca TaxID=29856 RepID=A0A8H7K439_BIOOC